MSEPLRILCIGAHPDDCECKASGSATMWAQAGHTVRFVSATNGETGHYNQGGVVLTQRRIAEAKAAAATLGVESQILPIPNGQLEPVLAYRRVFIRLIREFAPDLILTHRPNDYHPDHRYTSQLVQDSSYLVTVPNNCPETPALMTSPVIAYFSDEFQRPYAFCPSVVVNIDPAIERKVDALHCHVSQFYEWIPYNQGKLDQVPADPKPRRAWLFGERTPDDERVAQKYRPQLVARYGQKGQAVRFAEAFEGCEYGKPLDERQILRLFGCM